MASKILSMYLLCIVIFSSWLVFYLPKKKLCNMNSRSIIILKHYTNIPCDFINSALCCLTGWVVCDLVLPSFHLCSASVCLQYMDLRFLIKSSLSHFPSFPLGQWYSHPATPGRKSWGGGGCCPPHVLSGGGQPPQVL